MTKKKVQNLLKHLVCILLCLTVILPFYMVVINSFKSKGEASRMSLALPKEWLFSNYTEVIDKGNLIQGFSNSLLYALVATTFGVVLCAMAAFVMCRKRTRLNVFLYYFVLCGLFFPVNYVTLVRVLSPRASRTATLRTACCLRRSPRSAAGWWTSAPVRGSRALWQKSTSLTWS